MTNTYFRWLSPETLKYGKFSPKTDVWSFGITMWEIYSGGQEPYGMVQDNREVRRGVIEQRLKVSIPQDMPAMMQPLMLNCLAYNPDSRPTFHDLNMQLSSFKVTPANATFSGKLKEFLHL
ncbi:unnamed protein product [Gongylonema pulchrum]|uniref:Protein kinase domain-containing protein n=1 Tax=Gongylonema pulchrum TaxID=637853 RepID=A0A183CY32_9BILA|nr:unnamed protein product [Gongylonema pulchrum]